MEKLKVILLSSTPHSEWVVSGAAHLCYSPNDIETSFLKKDKKQRQLFIKKLFDMGHESPFEHINYTFGIEGISRACSHQLVRHRIASYSQQSQRYVNENNYDYIIPPNIEANEEVMNKYKEVMNYINEIYNTLVIDMGILEEDARYVLPNATETKIVVTMNARSLFNFFNLRLCNRAQWEIREVAKQMKDKVMNTSYEIFESAGPNCVTGECKEGEKSCKIRGD